MAKVEPHLVTDPPDQTAVGHVRSPRVAVIRHLRGLHQQGAIKVGEPIPSERSLARELGVHRATVRRALAVLLDEGFLRSRPNGERIVRSSPAAGKGVLNSTVAVLMPKLIDAADNAHPQHTQRGWLEVIGQGAIRALRQAGQGVVILPSGEMTEASVAKWRETPPTGFIVADVLRNEHALDRLTTFLAEVSCPLVVYGGHPRWDHVDRVVSDHVHGTIELYRFLRERGRKRILLVMPEPRSDFNYWVDQRIQGYEQAAAASHADFHRIIRVPVGSGNAWHADGFAERTRTHIGYMAEHLTGPNAVDAIMCSSDGSVFPVAAACRKLHRTPGEDIDIVGYDHYWRDAPERKFEAYEPPATVDKQHDEIGVAMVGLLQQRLEGSLDDEPQVATIQPRLVITDMQASRAVPPDQPA